MFTGLVQELGSVAEVVSRDGATRIRVEAALAGELSEGDSVAVNGVCLTAVEPSGTHFEADLSPETVARSSLGSLAPGERVNLELPLRPADRLGGHIVQGHVDGVGRLVSTSQTRARAATCASRLPRTCCATWSRRARSPWTE